MFQRKNEKSMANLEQYRAVLDDMERQRNEHLFKARELEIAMAALLKLMPQEQKTVAQPAPQQLPLAAISADKYTGMSVRWAILCLLTEDATGPMSTGLIAEALRAGGITSSGKSFAANVSAVLSDMRLKKFEVDSTDLGWIITERGRSAWIHIKATREKEGEATASTVQ